ncbi:hypothetical protein [Nonomuraea sp. NPDC049784]|uniref:hypothetical protein n=1 Tax=Nonomuraea sp. NPDC049784 TaxID=3154361 RepID=UPI0033F127B6
MLLALEFAGDVVEVLSQPFRLAFNTIDGAGEHIPDFLAVTRSNSWLIDVRPGGRIKAEDRIRFAAAAEIALSCGWRYAVAADWRPHVQTTLDTISSRRRSLNDPLGVQATLLAVVRNGPVRFGALVEQTNVPRLRPGAHAYLAERASRSSARRGEGPSACAPGRGGKPSGVRCPACGLGNSSVRSRCPGRRGQGSPTPWRSWVLIEVAAQPEAICSSWSGPRFAI